ncbi:hypothetical protein [Pelagicoccus sp. SDUM812005]|uniref:hypothetical protein n=1 Tax=Pelagicoccus sp. SDUM812005 TaxID=3041257 RepID=UPI0028100791|nr:hypothetical protein [Pelagicoccus sp. SDUM812005]MDQ8181058.1 hypothetical protein [Pelagicoccus sp. SDUM812005]
MKTHDSLSQHFEYIAQLLKSLRAGQDCFGKAYYEYRFLPEAAALAKLRLTYSVVERHLFDQLSSQEQAQLASKQENAGPFLNDPRSCIFGLEASLALDFLRNSDAQLFAAVQQNEELLDLDSDLLESWQATSGELNSDHTAKDRENEQAKASDSYALCG